MSNPEQPRRRYSDRFTLPSEMMEFSKADDPGINRLLKQIVHVLDGHAMTTQDINERLASMERTLDERSALFIKMDAKLDNLGTAITVHGIVETGRAWAPIITILTAILGIAWWLREHLNWHI